MALFYNTNDPELGWIDGWGEELGQRNAVKTNLPYFTQLDTSIGESLVIPTGWGNPVWHNSKAFTSSSNVRLDYCLEWCSLQALSKHTCKYATIPHFPHSTPNDSYAQPSSYSSGITNHTPSHVVSHNWSCQIKSPVTTLSQIQSCTKSRGESWLSHDLKSRSQPSIPVMTIWGQGPPIIQTWNSHI